MNEIALMTTRYTMSLQGVQYIVPYAAVNNRGLIEIREEHYGFECTDYLLKLFDTVNYNPPNDIWVIKNSLESFNGKHIDDYVEHIKSRASRNACARERYKKGKAKAIQIRQRFNNVVLSVDKDIDVFENGLNITLNLNPFSSRDARIKVLKSKDIIDFVKTEACKNLKVRSVLPICKLTRVALGQKPFAIFTFEPVDGVS